jgi:flagellar protein FlaF
MYQSFYTEHLAETPKECRARERRAFDRAIELLKRAQVGGEATSESADALHFLCRLWGALIEDLVSADNDLPETLRADLVSIGFWVIKEADLVRSGQSTNFRGLIDICETVRDGLR